MHFNSRRTKIDLLTSQWGGSASNAALELGRASPNAGMNTRTSEVSEKVGDPPLFLANGHVSLLPRRSTTTSSSRRTVAACKHSFFLLLLSLSPRYIDGRTNTTDTPYSSSSLPSTIRRTRGKVNEGCRICQLVCTCASSDEERAGRSATAPCLSSGACRRKKPTIFLNVFLAIPNPALSFKFDPNLCCNALSVHSVGLKKTLAFRRKRLSSLPTIA